MQSSRNDFTLFLFITLHLCFDICSAQHNWREVMDCLPHLNFSVHLELTFSNLNFYIFFTQT
jgi:hypothetical protein